MSATMLSSHSMTPLVTQRLEKDALNNLTDRFAAYLSRVRQMRDQNQLEDMGRERSSYQMMSAKNAAQLTDVNQRFDIQIIYRVFYQFAEAYRQC